MFTSYKKISPFYPPPPKLQQPPFCSFPASRLLFVQFLSLLELSVERVNNAITDDDRDPVFCFHYSLALFIYSLHDSKLFEKKKNWWRQRYSLK